MYKILTCDTKQILEEMVNEQLLNGYELVGGVSVTFATDIKQYLFVQAVYKKEFDYSVFMNKESTLEWTSNS